MKSCGKNRKGGHWEFPKGQVEGNENEEETMRREIKEETGITDLRIVPGYKKYIKYFFREYQGRPSYAKASTDKEKKPAWIFKLVVFFVAETFTKEVKISPEHTGFEWLLIGDAIEKTTFKNSKKLLKEANDFVMKNL